MAPPNRREISGHFVADGFSRAQAAAKPQVRMQVVEEYSERLEAANLWGRFWLRIEINREVKRRLSQVARPDSLY